MKKSEASFRMILIVGILFFLGMIGVANLFHFNYIMNADIASDAILGKLIWDSKEILPNTWYVANEVRIICTPNVAALFYGLIGNMNLSVGLACCFMTILVLYSLYHFGKTSGLNVQENLLFMLGGVAIPTSMIILELLYLYASYYAIHVVIFFLSLSIYVRMIKGERAELCRMITSFLFALILGVQGMRGILVLYGPLFGIEAIRIAYRLYCKEKVTNSDKKIALWVVGLLVISFVGTLFPISVGQGLSRNIRNGLKKLFTVVLPDVKKAIGFGDTNAIGKACLGIMVLLIVCLFIDLLVRMFRRKQIEATEWGFLVLCSSPVVSALMVAFTTIESTERYYFMFVYAMPYAVVLGLKKWGTNWKKGIAFVVPFMAAINILLVYRPIVLREEPPKTEFYEVSKYLEMNGYQIAYATFENANTMTVLSNGKVTVAPVASVEKMDICKWMTSTQWYVPNVPFEEKTAYIITETEKEDFGEFIDAHQGKIRFEVQIGKFLIYISDYNFSQL